MINRFLYQILAFTIHGKMWKKSYKKINLKYQLQHKKKELELLDRSCSISDIQDYVEYTLKDHKEKTEHLSIENTITFAIRTGYFLEILTPETLKLLGNTKSKINKNENGKNVPNIEITELVILILVLLYYLSLIN